MLKSMSIVKPVIWLADSCDVSQSDDRFENQSYVKKSLLTDMDFKKDFTRPQVWGPRFVSDYTVI